MDTYAAIRNSWAGMRYLGLVGLFHVSLVAQSPPDCNNEATRFVDVRCACIRDPGGQLCDMVRRGFHDSNGFNSKPINLGLDGGFSQPGTRTSVIPRAQPIRPQRARVVPLAHKDYLRFLHPNAQLVAGFDFEKVFQSPELMSSLFGADDADARNKMMGALKEMDHLWMSFVPPSDVVILMTGKFEQGVAAGMFYAQGIRPVFLAGAHAMIVGAEPSIQAALARLARPAPAGGWVTRRARELSKDHETWIVNEPAPGTSQAASALQAIRKFALGFRLTGEVGLDGEAVAGSEDSAEKIVAWIDEMKAAIREKSGEGHWIL